MQEEAVGITGKPDDPGSTRGKPDRERYTAAADQARLARNAMTRTTKREREVSGIDTPRHFQCKKCRFDGLENETNNSAVHVWMAPAWQEKM